MRDLITQAGDFEQVRRRNVRVVRNRSGQVGLRYVAPNGKIFFIEPNGYPHNNPKIYSKWPIEKGLSSGHSTHYYGSGNVCIGNDLSRFELYEILYLIDAWSKGFEKYLQTGTFPDRPSSAFGLRRIRRTKGFLESLFS